MSGITGIVLEGRGIIAVAGLDTRKLLQGLITNNVEKVTPERAIYSALLTGQGKFLHDFLVVQNGDTLLIDCEGPRRTDLMSRLLKYRLRANAEFTDETDRWTVAALIGDGAAAKLGLGDEPGRAKAYEGGVAFVDPRLGRLGVRLILPRERAVAVLEALADRIGTMQDFDAHRLALGVPDGSRDLEVEKTFLLESNAEALHAVDFTKGCYVGQELTARTKRRANLKWRLYPVELKGTAPAADSPVKAGEKEIGRLKSANSGHAMAYLRIEDAEAARTAGLPLVSGSAELTIAEPDWMQA